MIDNNSIIGKWELLRCDLTDTDKYTGRYHHYNTCTVIATNFNPKVLIEIKCNLEEKNKEKSYFISFRNF